MALVISQKTREKLASKHGVTIKDVEECLCDMGVTLIDTRENHKTDPPTQWFIGQTFMGKKLKVVFIFENDDVIIKSAFPPNADELRIYAKYAANE